LVVAVEPQKRLAAIIAKNAELNGCTNVRIEGSAIGDSAGERRFYLSPPLNTGASGFQRATKYPVPTTVVSSRTLQSLLDERGVNVCDLLKVDIEGAEFEAILGSPEVFRSQRVKAMLLALHERQLAASGRSVQQLLDFLGQCGYRPQPEFPGVWIADGRPS
jgi:FkbM family methyltransferase